MRALALSVKEPRGDHPNDDLAADYDKLAPSVDQGQWEKTTIKWPAALGREPIQSIALFGDSTF